MSICESIKKRFIRLSKGQRRVAQSVMNDPSIVTTLVAAEVGKIAGVSESTVIRFCYAMNFSGYGELRKRITEDLREKSTK